MPNIGCPLIGFYGALDKGITDGVPAFADKLKAQGKSFTPHIYAGAQHAFFNDTRPSYDLSAARDSFSRLLGFFNALAAR